MQEMHYYLSIFGVYIGVELICLFHNITGSIFTEIRLDVIEIFE